MSTSKYSQSTKIVWDQELLKREPRIQRCRGPTLAKSVKRLSSSAEDPRIAGSNPVTRGIFFASPEKRRNYETYFYNKQ